MVSSNCRLRASTPASILEECSSAASQPAPCEQGAVLTGVSISSSSCSSCAGSGVAVNASLTDAASWLSRMRRGECEGEPCCTSSDASNPSLCLSAEYCTGLVWGTGLGLWRGGD
eukprot:TRINITY_DN28911_c0_g1_i1.p3 TRINITY_DN28911_c0_g1~~TRINITY_DN28911_c0_g1_i1.p3  ORF type:complete len:115 (+),score=7.96 TRINITY_DN28911_c0_g1_i1:10-354(+)